MLLPTSGAYGRLEALNDASDRADGTATSTYLIDRWETEHGLPENSANAMVQTADGYLWFATFDGLVRFDGVRFHVLHPGNVPALPSAAIVNLHLDQRGRLWVSTLKGLVRRHGDEWTAFGTAEGWAGDYVRTFAERKNGDLLITTFDGNLLEFRESRLSSLPPPVSGGKGAYCGAVDEHDRWMVVRGSYAGFWDGGRWNEIAEIPAGGHDDAWAGAARGGGAWIIAGRELRKYQGGVEAARVTLSEAPGGVWSVFEDTRGNVWIATHDRGVCRVSPDGTIERWDTGRGLTHNGIRFIFEDHERNLWIGSSGGGLARFKARRLSFFDADCGIAERVIKSVWPHGGDVLIGSYGKGLFRLRENVATRVSLAAGGLGGSYVQSVLRDSAGRTWVGTYGDGLINLGVDGVRAFPHRETGGANVIAMYEDSRGDVWVSGGQGVAVLRDGAFKPVAPSCYGVCCFAEDASGEIWISNMTGVFRFQHEELVEVLAPGGAPLRDILCLRMERDGSVWMGSRKNGLLRWRPDGVDQIDGERGLPVNSISAIMEDEAGYWWMASNRGIVRAEASGLKAVADGRQAFVACQLLGADDGMEGIECASGRQPVCGRDEKGVMWFATSRGVASVDPSAFKVNPLPPLTHIEELHFERPVSSGEARFTRDSARVIDGQPRVLPPGSRRVEILYTATSFSAPGQVRFQTMLEGQDAGWQDAGSRRVASYHDLAPRDYVFRVRAANNDGVWNEVGSRMAFSVEPYFWQTWWFQTMVAAMLVVSGAGIAGSWARGHMARTRERVELREQRNELTHLARVSMLGELSGSLAHELNQPLTAILSNAQAGQRLMAREPVDMQEVREILADIVEQDKRAGEVIHRLRALFKRGEVVHQRLEMGEVIQDVVRLMRSDLANHGVVVESRVEPELPAVTGDRVQIQQVLLNLLINACDAMSATEESRKRLAVAVRENGRNLLHVSVIDAGTGVEPGKLERVFEPFFSTKEKGMGLGLAVCRTIIASHGGEMWATNNAEGGASFHFTLPISRGRS